ncbi:hypothetical protein BWGOE13_09640 [Bacillus mycoides]|nr:hypothetical protein BWGOE13_09640 [Bacillus mycoides]
MINKINNTTNKAKPPPQLLQLPPNPIIAPPLIRGENKGTLMYFNGFKLLYVFYAIIEQVLLKIKKRHPKVPSSDLNHLNFNNIGLPSEYYFTMLSCFWKYAISIITIHGLVFELFICLKVEINKNPINDKPFH